MSSKITFCTTIIIPLKTVFYMDKEMQHLVTSRQDRYIILHIASTFYWIRYLRGNIFDSGQTNYMV